MPCGLVVVTDSDECLSLTKLQLVAWINANLLSIGLLKSAMTLPIKCVIFIQENALERTLSRPQYARAILYMISFIHQFSVNVPQATLLKWKEKLQWHTRKRWYPRLVHTIQYCMQKGMWTALYLEWIQLWRQSINTYKGKYKFVNHMSTRLRLNVLNDPEPPLLT